MEIVVEMVLMVEFCTRPVAALVCSVEVLRHTSCVEFVERRVFESLRLQPSL